VSFEGASRAYSERARRQNAGKIQIRHRRQVNIAIESRILSSERLLIENSYYGLNALGAPYLIGSGASAYRSCDTSDFQYLVADPTFAPSSQTASRLHSSTKQLRILTLSVSTKGCGSHQNGLRLRTKRSSR
jgi:hypothetical protein